jgi:hypothetical protein
MTLYYLLHATNEDYTNFDKLKPGGTSDYELRDQYPGVYFSLITSDNFETEVLFNKKYYLLFSLELLKQKNFHINIKDTNGIISEFNTFFYWQLNEAIDKINMDSRTNKKTMNEVVFHDSINMKHLCKVIENTFETNLPKLEMRNDTPIDTSLLPCYCYYNDSLYTGINPPQKSSIEWINMMNLVCDTDLSSDEEYYKKVKYLYENREKQNFTPFLISHGMKTPIF